jgi:hypothetical protein
MRQLFRILLSTILLGVFLEVVPARAREFGAIESLEVALWPEYDRTAILVIYRAHISADSSLPHTVNLPIPTSVGEPNAVATQAADGTLEDADYTRSVDGEWATITIETESHDVWLEYYADHTMEGRERSYTFTWPGGVELGNFSYEVQQPLNASDLQITPPGEASFGPDGLTYYRLDLGPQYIASTLDIHLTYTRPAQDLSSAGLVWEDTQGLERLELALWPEYDRSAVLVIYQAQVPAGTPLPATVSLPIPAAIGEPHAVALRGAEGMLLEANYQLVQHGEWATVSMETDSPIVWVEFYSDLAIDGQERGFTFLWPEGIEIESLAFEVQQPVGANEMKITPAGSASMGDDGLNYYRRELGSVSASENFSISLTYDKSTPELSIGSVSPGLSLTRPETTQGRTPDPKVWLPWVVGSFGVLLVSVGVYQYIRLRRERQQAPTPRRRKRAGVKRRDEVGREIDASPVFCHNCGTHASASDRFCRRCGARLRQ